MCGYHAPALSALLRLLCLTPTHLSPSHHCFRSPPPPPSLPPPLPPSLLPQRCKQCSMPTQDHVRVFTHKEGSLTISVRKALDSLSTIPSHPHSHAHSLAHSHAHSFAHSRSNSSHFLSSDALAKPSLSPLGANLPGTPPRPYFPRPGTPPLPLVALPPAAMPGGGFAGPSASSSGHGGISSSAASVLEAAVAAAAAAAGGGGGFGGGGGGAGVLASASSASLYPSPFPAPLIKDSKIWMWHRCRRCLPVGGVAPATRRVAMSDAACKLSLGKFLELSFSNQAVLPVSVSERVSERLSE